MRSSGAQTRRCDWPTRSSPSKKAIAPYARGWAGAFGSVNDAAVRLYAPVTAKTDAVVAANSGNGASVGRPPVPHREPCFGQCSWA